jgi:3-oxoacyl-[acyl-carrier protein] reductase
MLFRDSGIQGKIAIVTGGSRGIGREVVKQLAAEGADVTFFFLSNQEAADAVCEECKQAGSEVTALRVDVRDSEASAEAVEAVLSRTDRIDILVNNSGVIRDGLLAAFADDDIADVLTTNVNGVFNVTRPVVPAMMRQRSGAIINISSVAGEKGGRGQTNYAASKGAVNALTRALAVELAPRKIRVNAVAPGVIDTEMSSEVRALAADESLERILLKRFGNAAEVAYLVCFLASRYGEYINGQIIHVDGGFKMA